MLTNVSQVVKSKAHFHYPHLPISSVLNTRSLSFSSLKHFLPLGFRIPCSPGLPLPSVAITPQCSRLVPPVSLTLKAGKLPTQSWLFVLHSIHVFSLGSLMCVDGFHSSISSPDLSTLIDPTAYSVSLLGCLIGISIFTHPKLNS